MQKESSIYDRKQRHEFSMEEILYQGKPLTQCTRAELLKLAYDAVRFRNINHVSFVEKKR